MIDVAPYFGIVGGATGVKNAHHGPVALADVDRITEIGMLETAIDRTAYHYFPLPWGEPAPGDQMDLRPHLDSQRGEKAGGDVGFSYSALAGQHNDENVFT